MFLLPLQLFIFCLPCFAFANEPIVVKALDPVSEQGLRQVLAHQINTLKVAMPGGTDCPTCLVTGFTVSPNAKSGQIQRSEINSFFATYPSEVQQKMQLLFFAESTVFHGFTFTIHSNIQQGAYNTYIGAGRRFGETVQWGIMTVEVRGTLVQKHDQVQTRDCVRRFGIRRCRDGVQHVPRGNTAQELSMLEQAFRHKAALALESQLGAIPVKNSSHRYRRSVTEDLEDDSFAVDYIEMEKDAEDDESFALSSDSSYSEETTSGLGAEQSLNQLKKDVMKYLTHFNKIQEKLDKETNETSVIIQRITGRGLSQFDQAMSSQTLQGVPLNQLERLSTVLFNMLQIPDQHRNSIKTEIFDKLPKSVPNQWLLFRLIFSLDDNANKYVCILANNNGREGVDMVLVDIRSKFTLAPDLLVIEKKSSTEWGTEKSEIIIQKVAPDSQLQQRDLKHIMNFLDLVAFRQVAKTLQIKLQ